MNLKSFGEVFPLGTHICREPMPAMSEMKRDMALVKAKGFNLIKLQENWMLDEPSEGRIDLSRYEELIDHAGKLDLGVYLGLTCEQAPNWLYEKYPDARMVRKDGLPVAFQAQSTLHADGKPGPCYDHPGAMQAQLRFIAQLTKTLGRFENLVVWNTWQEISYWAEMLTGGSVCYCENTIKAYQAWLSGLYGGDIGRLNAHWNVRYPSFESVQPDRCARKLSVPQQYYYSYFMDNVQIANVLKARCETIKANDPLHRPVFAHKGGPSLTSGADWTYARTQDFLGSSNYPAWGNGSPWDDHRQSRYIPKHDGLLTELWDGLAYKMDYIRSANRPDAPIWAAEFQGGRVSTDLFPGRVPTGEQMRRFLLTTLATGATAVSFWVTRAEIMAPETNGFSLLDSEGDTTERLDAVETLNRTLQARAPLFNANNRPQAQVALLVDEWNYRVLQGMDFAPEVLSYELRGWYKHLWQRGIPCDFVEASQLSDPRTMGYRAIIAPFAHAMSDVVAQNLIDFAQQGGHVLLEAAPGMLSEVAMAPRGMMNPLIRRALGVTMTSHSLVREPGERDRFSQPERTWGEYEQAGMMQGMGPLEGTKLRASVMVETYSSDTARPLMSWQGRPCGYDAAVGEGSMMLIGSCLGFCATAYQDDDSKKAMDSILEMLSVEPEHMGRLLLTRRVGDKCQAWFVTNPYDEEIEETFQVNGNAILVDESGERALGSGEIRLRLKQLDVQLVIVEE
ncbi:beta-galactosidase [Eubacteriales bacterium OttesenSCG-928-N13]|nr:beta-galactosidase [Eubacteriales bacterium OttesenSCG-928-N13]